MEEAGKFQRMIQFNRSLSCYVWHAVSCVYYYLVLESICPSHNSSVDEIVEKPDYLSVEDRDPTYE